MYRVTHLVANLGWVDFDLGCSTYSSGHQPGDLPISKSTLYLVELYFSHQKLILN